MTLNTMLVKLLLLDQFFNDAEHNVQPMLPTRSTEDDLSREQSPPANVGCGVMKDTPSTRVLSVFGRPSATLCHALVNLCVDDTR